MDWSTLVIAFALAMDAFAVSISNGIPLHRIERRHIARFGLYFGIFQGGMTAIGYLVGRSFSQQLQAFDHWIAFILLALIGANMVKEALDHEEDAPASDAMSSHKTMLVLSIATSIDALAAGVGLSLVGTGIWFPVIAITLVTLVLSGLGVYLGYRIGRLFKKGAEILGGSLLVAMGLKILLEHLSTGV